jgi:hypothetical protein
MAEDDIVFLLDRGKLVEPHEIKENWKVKTTSSPLFKRKAMSSSAILTFQFCFISWGSTSFPLFKRKAMSSSAILTFQLMAKDDIAFLLNRGKLVESHEIKQSWKVKMAEDDIAFLLNRGKLV